MVPATHPPYHMILWHTQEQLYVYISNSFTVDNEITHPI